MTSGSSIKLATDLAMGSAQNWSMVYKKVVLHCKSKRDFENPNDLFLIQCEPLCKKKTGPLGLRQGHI